MKKNISNIMKTVDKLLYVMLREPLSTNYLYAFTCVHIILSLFHYS